MTPKNISDSQLPSMPNLSFSPSNYLIPPLSICPSVSGSIHPSIHPSIHQSIHPSIELVNQINPNIHPPTITNQPTQIHFQFPSHPSPQPPSTHASTHPSPPKHNSVNNRTEQRTKRHKKMTCVEYADFGEIADTLPLLADVLLVSDDDDVLEFIELEVAGGEWHDEVAQSDDRRMRIGKQADDHVIAQHRHRRLLSCLWTQHQMKQHRMRQAKHNIARHGLK